jgi:predicted glycogen debranching enzyme
MTIDDRTEWLEADGLGGFASGTTSGVRTRRYHALLLAATTPPTGRMVLVNGIDAFVDTPGGTFALSSQRYMPDVIHPDGASRIVAFRRDPWPTWEFVTNDGTRIRHEIVVPSGAPSTILRWEVLEATGPIVLRMRPFLSGRDYHALHHENAAFQFEPQPSSTAPQSSPDRERVVFAPYPALPAVEFRTNGEYRHSPLWYRHFLYQAERERGLDDTEDLAAPGEFRWQLSSAGDSATCILRAMHESETESHTTSVELDAEVLRSAERARRTAFPDALDRAADAYLVRRRTGRTLVAGYPWFTDWGWDTFIAVRGLCLATGRLGEARDILLEWSNAVSEGMLPNRFPDRGEEGEFNAVDASLWYVVAVHELLQQAARLEPFAHSSATASVNVISADDELVLRGAVDKIVRGYAAGTRFGIGLDADGLLMAGTTGVQLTWMDARVGDRVITPRIGKPVEIQALWLNAVAVAAETDPAWNEVFERGRTTFIERFWNASGGYLADVVDVDHIPGTRDDTFRPNQILAIGGLPIGLLGRNRARQVVDEVERRLLTPLGLRSLAPGESGYSPRYEGDASHRDTVYHQGTVWPWLIGPFVHAWLRAHGNTAANRSEARRRFLQPLLAHLETAGLGHISEIADAEPPFTPRGCPFQAWSLGELIRLDRVILQSPVRPTLRRVEVQTV